MAEEFIPVDLERLAERKARLEITAERKAKGRAEYEKKKPELIVLAILKHLEGVSYRGLRVGASIIADNPNVEGGGSSRGGA